MPELIFFVGKGGVGKTTLSSAYAVRAASQARGDVLLVSTDPAHSLSDVFASSIGDRQVKIATGGRGQLIAWEINAARRFEKFLATRRQQLIAAIEQGSLFTSDEISSLLDSALPGAAELAALIAISDAMDSGRYSTVVVDSAPFGHTLRLFQLPEQLLRLLRVLELSVERDQALAAQFAGQRIDPQSNTALDEWSSAATKIHEMFAAASVCLVTTPETFALNESARCLKELIEADDGPKLNAIVLNRVIRKPGACPLCRQLADASRKARARLNKNYRRTPLYVAEDPGTPILGISMLKRLADSVFARRPLAITMDSKTPRAPDVHIVRARWPVTEARITFVLGKGGVGKTTVSAGLGYVSRQNSKAEVEICSVDPAPSLDDVFVTPVGDKPISVLGDRCFRASEFDSRQLYRGWVADIRAEVDASTSYERSGVQIELNYERRMLSELLEIVPPGLDEVLAISRIVDVARAQRKIIIDMAPTGHALELLRTPERVLSWSRLLLKSLASHRKLALAREAAVKIAELEVRARELSQMLPGPQVTPCAVMLPEFLPDRETERLVSDLRQMNLTPSMLFVNRVILPSSAGKCRRCSITSARQLSLLSGVREKLNVNAIYVIPALKHEPRGKKGVRQLTNRLWKLH